MPSGSADTGRPSGRGEAIEQVDPDVKRELLAGDAVDERLEDGWKARGLEPPHAGHERAEQRVAGGHRRES
jgi:hypothetical protein